MTVRDADRRLTVEIWYPAALSYRGLDLDDATRDRYTVAPELPVLTQDALRDADPSAGRFPFLLCSHGTLGHRRVLSTVATHLASHGYVVAANDVPGDNTAVMMRDVVNAREGRPIARPTLQQVNRRRPYYASLTIDRVLDGDDPLIAAVVDPARIGAFGQSAGGWNTLRLNSIDRRIKASFAIQPMFGTRTPVKVVPEMAAWLRTDDWGRPVPTFVLAGEADPMIILDDLRDLYAQLPAPKRFANLPGAGHMHFTDHAEWCHEMFRGMFESSFPDPNIDAPAMARAMRPFSELCPAAHALDVVRGLTLAHFDAELKDNDDARTFLDRDLAAAYAARGIDLEVAAATEDALVG